MLVLITGIMGKTTAQKGAHVVKDGIRHKDVYATAVGDTTNAYFVSWSVLRRGEILNFLFQPLHVFWHPRILYIRHVLTYARAHSANFSVTCFETLSYFDCLLLNV